MRNKCPYCKKTDCIPEVAFVNCENYGNTRFVVKCNHCKKVLDISLCKIITVDYVQKSNKTSDETDW